MKINYIKTIGFRKFEKEFETKLYDTTNIIGGNTKGKTNILYAIVWAFLGSNLTGDEKVWLGNKKSDDCYVQLKFTDNKGIEHTLERYKNKYDNKKNYLLLDNMNTDAGGLQEYYKEKKLFLSILNPNYFITKAPADQKKLIDSYLPKLDISTVYEKLENSEKKLLEGVPRNITDYLKGLNEDKKTYEDKIKQNKGKIEYAEKTASEVVEDKKVFDKEDELQIARRELTELTTNVELENKKRIVDNLEKQIMEKEQQIVILQKRIVNNTKLYSKINNAPVSCCPTCEQEIKDKSKFATLSKIKKELECDNASKKEYEESLSTLKGNLTIAKCKLHAVDGKSNVEKAKKIALVQAKLNKLEQEKLEVETHNKSIVLKTNSINGAKQDIETFRREIKEYNKMLDNLKETKKVAEKLFINYIEEKMKFATKHLKKVGIKYYSVLKESGEIKEDFVITYNNNELKNLSRSETIATSLEICNMFNKISGVNIPLFIDDSESCADYNFTQEYANDTQVLIARVEKAQELQILDGNKQNEYLKVA